MEIKVNDNCIGLGDKSIQVVINDVKFNSEVIAKPSIMFWLDEDAADSLAFHLGAVLQERSRAKESQKKAGQI